MQGLVRRTLTRCCSHQQKCRHWKTAVRTTTLLFWKLLSIWCSLISGYHGRRLSWQWKCHFCACVLVIFTWKRDEALLWTLLVSLCPVWSAPCQRKWRNKYSFQLSVLHVVTVAISTVFCFSHLLNFILICHLVSKFFVNMYKIWWFLVFVIFLIQLVLSNPRDCETYCKWVFS